MDDPIRILIVDDHNVVRHGLHLMLDLKAGLAVVGEASNGIEAIDQVRRLSPDVVLMDLAMPVMGGIEAITAIHNEFAQVRILVLTSFSEDQQISAAIQAGAMGYLLKDSTPQELVHAIQEIYQGHTNLSPEITSRLVKGLQKTVVPEMPAIQLTPREDEILRLAACGLSNLDIARELFISEGTVRFHISHIFTKLGVSSRSQAVLYALRQGWVKLRDDSAPHADHKPNKT